MRTQGTITNEDVAWDLMSIRMYTVGPALAADLCPCGALVTHRIDTPIKSLNETCNVYLPCGHACVWNLRASASKRLLVAPDVLTRLLLSL